DAILNIFLKTFRCDLQAIVSDRKFQKNVITTAICGRTSRQTRFHLPCCHRGAQNESTGWVCNCAANVSRDLLSRQTEASKHYKCQHIANVVHIFSSLPEGLHYKQTDAGASRDTLLTLIAVTCGSENVPHRQRHR